MPEDFGPPGPTGMDREQEALFAGPATQPHDALPAGERRPRGAYYTPDALAMGICTTLRLDCGVVPSTTFEPGCGGGAFLRAASVTWPRTTLLGVDTEPACVGPGSVERGDLFRTFGAFELIVGNPDFGQAEMIVRHCLSLRVRGGYLAFLLRLNMLAGKARAALYAEHPLCLFQPIAGRPSFTGGGTDASDYGLFVWKEGHVGEGRILPPLVWR